MSPEVVMIGLGYIGLPTAALIASNGTQVHGVDINQKVVDTIKPTVTAATAVPDAEILGSSNLIK